MAPGYKPRVKKPYQRRPRRWARKPFPQALIRAQEIKGFDAAILAGNLVAYSAPPVWSVYTAAFTGFTTINPIPSNTGYFGRIGSKIMMTSVAIGGQLIASAATVVTEVRLVLVYDKQSNSGQPAFTDVFLAQPAGVGTFTSSINLINRSRFSIIRDQYYGIDPGQGFSRSVKLFAKGKWESQFNLADNNPTTGSMLVFAFIGTQVGAGTVSFANFVCRTRYLDN